MREIVYAEIDGTIKKETELAILLDLGGDDPQWVPRSLIGDMEIDKDGTTHLTVQEWFAIKENLV